MYFLVGLVCVGILVAVYLKNSGSVSGPVEVIKGIAGKFAGIFKQK